jgi:hypothetical protein
MEPTSTKVFHKVYTGETQNAITKEAIELLRTAKEYIQTMRESTGTVSMDVEDDEDRRRITVRASGPPDLIKVIEEIFSGVTNTNTGKQAWKREKSVKILDSIFLRRVETETTPLGHTETATNYMGVAHPNRAIPTHDEPGYVGGLTASAITKKIGSRPMTNTNLQQVTPQEIAALAKQRADTRPLQLDIQSSLAPPGLESAIATFRSMIDAEKPPMEAIEAALQEANVPGMDKTMLARRITLNYMKEEMKDLIYENNQKSRNQRTPPNQLIRIGEDLYTKVTEGIPGTMSPKERQNLLIGIYNRWIELHPKKGGFRETKGRTHRNRKTKRKNRRHQ